MIYDTPYKAIVRDAIEGKDVVLFCDTSEQARAHLKALMAELERQGVTRGEVHCDRRRRRLLVRCSHVWLVLANGVDGRGLSVDVAYLSDGARLQANFSRLMGAEIR